MRDIIIYCPCGIHTDVLRYHDYSNKKTIIPKILLIVSETTIGEITAQCCDPRCRRYNGANHNGYYKIKLTGTGSYTIELLKKQSFNAQRMPHVELGDD